MTRLESNDSVSAFVIVPGTIGLSSITSYGESVTIELTPAEAIRLVGAISAAIHESSEAKDEA